MNWPHLDNPLGPVFLWVLLTLALFRVTRFVTTDTFPPMAWLRRKLETMMGSKWGELVGCNWCAVLYLGTASFYVAAQMMDVPLPALQAIAAMAVVGFVGNWDE